IAIAVDGRVAQPWLEVGLAAGIGREDIDGRMHADLRERVFHLRVLRPLQLRLDGVDINLRRLSLSDQDTYVYFPFVGAAPDDAVRERVEECGNLALDRVRI